jgi:hypothetical protein
MTPAEWTQIAQQMVARWPHSDLPDSSLAVWFDDLKDLSAEVVATAVMALYRDGRDFPPNGAQILAKVSELDRDDPDWGRAWELANKASWKHMPYDGERFIRTLEEQSPATAEAVRRFGIKHFGERLVRDEGTDRAQFRQIYEAVVKQRRRDDAYAGLPNAGLRQIEQAPQRAGGAIRKALELAKGDS